MGATGTATLDFGTANYGSDTASVTITGQTAIAADSYCEAWFMADTSADATSDEHLLVARETALACGTIVVGTGFTIEALSDLRLTGRYSVRWVWS
jgi:hypothetical protein